MIENVPTLTREQTFDDLDNARERSDLRSKQFHDQIQYNSHRHNDENKYILQLTGIIVFENFQKWEWTNPC